MKVITPPLFPYHTRIREQVRSKPKAGLFTFYGSGKTYMSLQWLADTQQLPAIVLAPRSVIGQWGQQIEQHTQGWKSISILDQDDPIQRAKSLKKGNIVVMNYDAIRSPAIQKVLRQRIFQSLIIDESPAYKDMSTQRWQQTYNLLRYVGNRCILSGRPVTEKVQDLWGQLFMLDHGATLGRSYTHFQQEYFHLGTPWDRWAIIPKADTIAKLGSLVKGNCVVVLKDEVAHELPPKRYVEIEFDLPSEVRRIYDKAKKEAILELAKVQQEHLLFWALTKTTKLHQLGSSFVYEPNSGIPHAFESPKIEWLKENVPIIIESRGSCIIWSPFTFLTRQIAKELRLPYYDGPKQTPYLEQFKKGDIPGIVLSIQAANSGLNLQQCNANIYVANTHSGSMRENSEDRTHRIGSNIHDDILYIDLISKNTLDRPIRNSLIEKREVGTAILEALQ